MHKFLPLLLVSLMGFAHADEALVARKDVQAYIKATAAAYQFSEEELVQTLSRATPKSNVLDILDRPSTARPWYTFRVNFVNPARSLAGAKFWREHAIAIKEISERYEVEPEVIVAILGAETNYGKNTGSFHILDVLTTIAFDYPRRAEFFQKELTEFLLLAREENEDPLSFKGSYAGAMGWPQFMPSSFRQYAVDYDQNGHRDIWSHPNDAIASVAHYLKEHGWQEGKTAYTAVNINADLSEVFADKFNLHYSVGDLMQKGVVPISELDTAEKAVLFSLETEPGFTRHFLGFNNFYVITRYNKSTLYATAVLQLSESILKSYQEGDDLRPAKPTSKPTKKKW
ncbi:MAG: lytic murein transglycosylase [Pseudomonadota bacterium]|jgi:membrane-bound lytic murein transglycosylase B